jgi:exodeoxyribonuclease VII large subunit
VTPTWSVAELHEALNAVLDQVFGDVVWVEGEVRNLKRSAARHVYFDLVDADWDGPEGQRPSLSVTLFNAHRERVNRFLREQGGAVRMDDGVRLRIGGRLGTYAVRSTLQLLMDRIDPAFTLGVLGQERRRLLAALADEGLLRANAEQTVPPLPLSVALVTSRNSAAHADALDELQRSGIGFRVTVLDARTQGVGAEASVCSALHAAERRGVDVVLLVRGGGAATDLAAFDTEAIARTIADLTVPVFTGIGHETDRSVADEVAHTAHKTPTAAAAAVVAAVRDAATEVDAARGALRSAALGRLVRAGTGLDRVARRCGTGASHRLHVESRQLDVLADRISGAAPRALTTAAGVVDDTAQRLRSSGTRCLEVAALRVDGLAGTAAAHDPALALARGWSVTQHPDGRIVRQPAELAPGDPLVTRLAGGTVTSTVTTATDRAASRPTADAPTASATTPQDPEFR